jgi:hypothetical protein
MLAADEILIMAFLRRRGFTDVPGGKVLKGECRGNPEVDLADTRLANGGYCAVASAL